MISRVSKLFFTLILVLVSGAVHAFEVINSDKSHSNLTVTLEGNGYVAGKTSWLAVTFTPLDEWHTYWKNYGDSGAAPILSWKTPATIEVGGTLYPAPELIPVGPLMNYGYHGASTLLIPVKVTEEVSGEGLPFTLSAEWLVCKVECIPQYGEWSFTVPSASGKDSAAKTLFKMARAKIPEPSYWQSDLTLFSADALLTVFADKADFEDEIADAYFFPAGEGIANYATPQKWHWADTGLQLQIERPSGATSPVDASGVLSLTSKSGKTHSYTLKPVLEATVTNTLASASDSVTPQNNPLALSLPLWQALIFALAGGIILNLMPCVFPVLSLKVMALVKGQQKSRRSRILEGWSYTGGIWISFMVIVLILALLRAGGMAIGWGFQLQSPLFVAVLAAIMLVVALALFGLFTVETGLEGAGNKLTQGNDLRASFFKGVLATLVATPCTAPLMAPAIGYALTQSFAVNLIVFSVLAFGMALPFLGLCYSDKLAQMMPKPGTWMVTLRQALAFPMLLTVCWLIYVFSIQTDETATFVLLCALTAIAFAFWLWQISDGKTLKLIAVLTIFLSIYGVIDTSKDSALKVEAIDNKTSFSEDRLAALLKAGQPTFVYFTAEWCITCKVNEKTVLQTTEIQTLFQDLGITVLKADWTNRNAEIATILARFGRAGVPMYLYYPAGQNTPILLPELLTKSTLKETLNTGV